MSTLRTITERALRWRLWARIGGPIAGFAVVLAVLATAVLMDIARREDSSYREMTRRMVESALAAQSGATAELTLDYANWDESYDATTRRWNQSWLTANFYSSVLDAVIVAREGQMRFLWTSEALNQSRGAVSRDALAVVRGFEDLNALASAPLVSDTARTALLIAQDQLAVLAIVPITPDEDAERMAIARAGQPVDVLLGVRMLEANDLGALGTALDLEDFRFDPDGAPADGAISLPLAESGGGAASFLWRDARPGSAGIAPRLWLVLSALAILGLATA